MPETLSYSLCAMFAAFQKCSFLSYPLCLMRFYYFIIGKLYIGIHYSVWLIFLNTTLHEGHISPPTPSLPLVFRIVSSSFFFRSAHYRAYRRRKSSSLYNSYHMLLFVFAFASLLYCPLTKHTCFRAMYWCIGCDRKNVILNAVILSFGLSIAQLSVHVLFSACARVTQVSHQAVERYFCGSSVQLFA